jgi:hypothetical protein
MPFVSESQRKWMWANKPNMAKEWQSHTPENAKLPEHTSSTKESAVQRLYKSASFRALVNATSGTYKIAVELSTMANDEQRRQDLHNLEIQHAQDKHELDMTAKKLDIQKGQVEFKLKIQDLVSKQKAQAAQRQQASADQQMMQAQPALSDMAMKSNLSQMGKAAAEYDDYYGQSPMQSKAEGLLQPLAAGGAVGALGSHLVFPVAKAKELFSRAHLETNPTTKWNLRAQGMGANFKRTMHGAGAGMLAALIANELSSS